MATRYFCDVCGKEVGSPDELTHIGVGAHIDGTCSSFNGNVCGECNTNISIASDLATIREIAKIREAVSAE